MQQYEIPNELIARDNPLFTENGFACGSEVPSNCPSFEELEFDDLSPTRTAPTSPTSSLAADSNPIEPLSVNRPYHVAYVYDNVTHVCHIYVDGQPCFSARLPVGMDGHSNGPLHFGAWHDKQLQGFQGIVHLMLVTNNGCRLGRSLGLQECGF